MHLGVESRPRKKRHLMTAGCDTHRRGALPISCALRGKRRAQPAAAASPHLQHTGPAAAPEPRQGKFPKGVHSLLAFVVKIINIL